MVTIEGIAPAQFTECVLPAVSVEVVEYRQGTDKVDNIHKLPGLVRYGNLVLKRGLTGSLDLWDWFSKFLTGVGVTKSVTVSLLDGQRNAVVTWTFANAWPLRYESPPLDGKTSAMAIETLELAVEGMAVTSTGQSA
jgi:phage tail-like protein